VVNFKRYDDIYLTNSNGIQAVDPKSLPPKKHLANEKFVPDIANVDTWEEIFRKQNYVGVYAAWSPYVEFYLVVHELFLNTEYACETFFGPTALNDTVQRIKSLGITLDKDFVWVESIDHQNFVNQI